MGNNETLQSAFSKEYEEYQNDVFSYYLDEVLEMAKKIAHEKIFIEEQSEHGNFMNMKFCLFFCWLIKTKRLELEQRWPFEKSLLEKSFIVLGYSYQ
jgi:hypothetical protein